MAKISNTGFPQQSEEEVQDEFSSPFTKKRNEIVQSFYSIHEPEPVVDQAKLDRLQRMGRINGLGRGVSVLSDALAVGMGANVNRRQPDQTSPALYAAYQNTLDKFDTEKKSFDYRKYQGDKQNKLFELQQLQNDEQTWLMRERQKLANEIAKAKLEYDRGKDAQANALKIADLQYKYDALKARTGNDNTRNAIAAERNDIAAGKSNKPFMIAGLNGKETPLNQGEFRAYLEQAAKDPSFKDFKAAMEGYENNPLEGQKNIVQRYLTHLENKKKAKESAAQAKQQVNTFIQNSGIKNAYKPIPQKQTPAKAVEKPKKIKLEKGSLDNL